MSNYVEKKIELIESLMEEKSFGELSEGERLIVLEILASSDEYDRMRMIHQNFAQKDKLRRWSPEPDPAILKKIVKTQFPWGEQKDTLSKSIFTRLVPIPVYQIGLAACLVVFIMVSTKKPVKYIDRPVLVEKIVRDTIKTAPETDTVYLERYITKFVKEKTQPVVSLDETVASLQTGAMTNAEEYLSMVNKHKGFSLKDKEYILNLSIGNE